MPRKLELTFQKGGNGRAGRWKKFYRGSTYYLGNGRNKSDLESYRKALAKWRKLEMKLNAELPDKRKPHEKEYDEVIGEWELVLSWAVQHGEDEQAAIAREKLAELRTRREKPKPPPITHADRLWSRFRPDQAVLREIGEMATASRGHEELARFRAAMFQSAIAKNSSYVATMENDIAGVDSLRRAEIQWEDRLANQGKVVASEETQTLEGWVKRYLGQQQHRVSAEDLSAGRFISGQAALGHFRDWVGPQILVSTISGQTLSSYHSHQLELIASNKCAPGYARDRMASVRAFIRWLWGQDAIEQLPKNIDSNELKIARRTVTPKTFEVAEIKELLGLSSGRTRLYILLGLNCGMQQKDISDLKTTDVAWRDGTITRKRSKTQKHQCVPTVTYQLWPETMALLREFRSDSDVVLLNRNGDRLLQERLEEDGSYKKSDNIKNAYERVIRKASFSKPFKLLRKTSATLIDAEERFRGLDELFLGHAPSTIAKKHYTATGRSALDAALEFLRTKYEIDKIDEENASL
jgi:integrase